MRSWVAASVSLWAQPPRTVVLKVVVLVLGVNPFLQSDRVNSAAQEIRAAFLVRNPGHQVKLFA